MPPNKRVETNRPPAFPLDAGRTFKSASCALPSLSAAVAHPQRSAGVRIRMRLHIIALLSFSLLAPTSGCLTRHANSPLCASDVFDGIGIKGVTNAALLARTSNSKTVVVTGTRGEKHVAAVAYWDTYRSDHGWALSSISVMMKDGICRWYLATDEYDQPPTRADVAALLLRVNSQQSIRDFVFQEASR